MNLKSLIITQLCILLMLITANETIPIVFSISTAIDVAAYGYKGIQAMLAVKKSINEKLWKAQVLESLSEIYNSTRRIESLITEEADRIIKELSVKFDMKLVREFTYTVHTINERYEKKFSKYFLSDDVYQQVTIETFINETISEYGFRKVLHSMNTMIVPTYYLPHLEDKRLFNILLDYYQIKSDHHRDCNEGSSQHQQLFAVYNLAAITLIKGYAMVIHAYKYRQQYAPSPNAWEPEIVDTIDELKETLLAIAVTARTFMDRADQKIIRCDPKKYSPDTFIRLTGFLSSFITTQTYMTPDQHCYGSCSDYSRFYPHRIQRARRYPQLNCDGVAYDCWKSNVVSMCLGSPENDRRFEGLSEFYYFSHHRRGNWSETCDRKKIAVSDFINADIMCSTCACTCDKNVTPESIRTFSLREHYTDIADDRVVTGVRFIVKNGVISLEIQEGKLIQGSIDLNSVRWNPNASYASTGPETAVVNYNSRSINLDDVVLPTGVVVTGVKFAMIDNNLSLMVAGVSKYNELGQDISSGEMKWYSAEKTARTELKLSSPDIPVLSDSVNLELSKSGQHYVKFQLSDWKKDASQTVVPYLESQEVISEPPTPLGGLGLFYKGHTGTGGFISLKLIASNYTIHITEENLSKIFYNYDSSQVYYSIDLD